MKKLKFTIAVLRLAFRKAKVQYLLGKEWKQLEKARHENASLRIEIIKRKAEIVRERDIR